MKRVHLEEMFEHKGYKCACTFTKMGFRCGYVAVDNTHPWFGKDFNDYGPEEIECHWGLTYAGEGKHFYDEDDNLWWFGFDCGHCSDMPDYKQAKEYGLINEQEYFLGKRYESMLAFDDSTVKDLEFVKENCKLIVEQLHLIKKRGI